MPTVDDGWPDYWVQVDVETAKVGSSRAAYVAMDHDHVVDWFTRHWDLLEPLVDDPNLGHIRFATFDGDQLSYRFRVIGMEAGVRFASSSSRRSIDRATWPWPGPYQPRTKTIGETGVRAVTSGQPTTPVAGR